MFVVAGPREKFSETEINHMKKFLEEGGALLVLLGEGGEKRYADTKERRHAKFIERHKICIKCWTARIAS